MTSTPLGLGGWGAGACAGTCALAGLLLEQRLHRT